MAIVKAKNGALRDTETGHFVPGGKVETAIDSPSKAREFHDLRRKRKQETIAARANEMVENDHIRTQYGDLAFVAAITDAQYIKATTPDDPKSTDAARFIFTETGLAEPKQAAGDTGARVTVELGADALQAVLAALNGGDMSNYHKHSEVVDAQAEEVSDDEK